MERISEKNMGEKTVVAITDRLLDFDNIIEKRNELASASQKPDRRTEIDHTKRQWIQSKLKHIIYILN